MEGLRIQKDLDNTEDSHLRDDLPLSYGLYQEGFAKR